MKLRLKYVRRWGMALAQPVTYVGVLTLVATVIALVHLTHQHKETDYVDAVRHGDNLTLILEKHVSTTIKKADSALLFLRALYLSDPAKFDLSRWVNDSTLRNDLTFQVGIVDASGHIKQTSFGPLAKPLDVSDREAFRAHVNTTEDKLFIALPITLRTSGKWSIQLTRPIIASDGSFAGVITSSLDPYQLLPEALDLREQGFANVSSIPHRAMLLRASEGKIDEKFFGFSTARGGIFERYQKDPVGHYWNDVAIIDPNRRLISYRTVTGLPLVVAVGQAENAIYGATAQVLNFYYGIGALLTISVLIAIGIGAAREFKLSNTAWSLKLTNKWLDAALENMPHGLCMFDKNQRLVVSNRQYATIYNLKPEQAKPGTQLRTILEARIDANSYSLNPEKYLQDTLEFVSQREPQAKIDELRDGRILAVNLQPTPDGGWVAVHQDITEQKRAEERIAHVARHDALTGLPNRTVFMEAAEKWLQSPAPGKAFSTLLLDLDNFKLVNDSAGHAVGDALLKMAAQRLLQCVDRTDIVTRLGGDEFTILQAAKEGDAREEAIILANRLIAAISEPYEINGREETVGTSIGINVAPDHGTDANQLLKNADLALYQAKSEGRGKYCFFEAIMETEARRLRELELDLRAGIARGEFLLHFQPVFNAKTQEPCGAEALVRWHRPQHGMVSPADFIPLAERTGLIVPLGEWVLQQACQQAAKWPAHIKVAVNLSPAQFRKGQLLDTVTKVLDETGLAPERLELEITETVLLDKNEANLAILHQLQSLGVDIVLDDFGTGYSSLSYLQAFHFNKIKIDQSFVRQMTTSNDCAEIICAVIGLARGLDIHTTAEGVETKEQLELLRITGCAQIQGYLLGRPVPAAELHFAPAQKKSDQAAA